MILWLDQIKELVEANILGSSLIFAVFVIFVLLVLLIATKISAKESLLLISPAIISVAGAALIPSWFKPLIFICIGIVLATVIYKLISSYSES